MVIVEKPEGLILLNLGTVFYSSIAELKRIFMRSILYLIAIILVIGWVLGFFVGNATGLIHILLVLAVVSLLLGFIRRGSID